MAIYALVRDAVPALASLSGAEWLALVAGGIVMCAGLKVGYELLLSPYRRIPGAFLARVSSWYTGYYIMRGTHVDVTRESYFKYGNAFMVMPGFVALSDPADCRRVLGTGRFKKTFYEAFRIVDEMMFTTTDAAFNHTRRRQIGPAFTHGYLANMEATILECGIKAIKRKWGRGTRRVNFGYDFSLATFDTISALGFGARFDALAASDVRVIKWANNYTDLGMLRFAVPAVDWFPLRLLVRGMHRIKDEFVAYSNRAIEERRARVAAGAEAPRDLLQALLDAEDPVSKAALSERQITAETIGFLLGGTDTTSQTMMWTLHLMLLYPGTYKRAVAEIRAAFAAEHLITYSEGRAQLPYLEACIYESMRVNAVSGTLLPRVVPEGGATFQGHFLPAGTIVGVSIGGVNHNTAVWENPRRFIPERFLDNEKAKQQVLTFSSGVRICPGRNLAWVEMITILANLLKDYDFALPEDSLFGPDVLDKHGNPVVMPSVTSLTTGPRYPGRDCWVVISEPKQ